MEININREVEDTFYRYKMPKLSAKVEGKGNGIKTVIVNVSDIAKALNRKPIYLTKYFGCELGAQIHVDDKNERYIVNGAHEAAKLQELLDGFIKKFVLCQGCGNPETTMHVSKRSGTVDTTCKACGSRGQLDVVHRLTQYIMKNPPDPDTTAAKVKVKKGKKTKNGERNSDDDHDTSAAGGDENSRFSPPGNAEDGEDDDWGEDTTEEAQMQRMNELSAMAKSLALSVDVDKSESERANVFFKHLRQLFHKDEIITYRREIKAQADGLDLGPRAVLVIAEVVLSSPSSIVTDIEKYAPVFLLFTRIGRESKRAQHYVLGAMCKLIERFDDHNLLGKSCHILKALYDSDIVEEDVICAWNDKGPSKKFVSRELSAKILNQCAPMVKWLKEAEEESDESENDDDDESQQDLENYSESKENVLTPDSKDATESEDEIDIDAI